MISPANFSCKEALDLLDDFRRNDIEPHLRVMLTEHLENCDACSAELRLREAMAARLTAALPATPPPTQLSPRVRREINRVTPSGTERKNAQLLPLMLTAAVIIMIGVAMLQMNTAPSLHRATDLASARTNPPPGAQARAEKQRTLAAPSEEREFDGPLKTRSAGQAQTGATAGGEAKAMRALKSENFAGEAVAPAPESMQDQAASPPAQMGLPQVSADRAASPTALPATLGESPAPLKSAPSTAPAARNTLFRHATSETTGGLVNSATTAPLSADTHTSLPVTNPADAPTTSPAAPAPAP